MPKQAAGNGPALTSGATGAGIHTKAVRRGLQKLRDTLSTLGHHAPVQQTPGTLVAAVPVFAHDAYAALEQADLLQQVPATHPAGCQLVYPANVTAA
jgi:hypothetical protein